MYGNLGGWGGGAESVVRGILGVATVSGFRFLGLQGFETSGFKVLEL